MKQYLLIMFLFIMGSQLNGTELFMAVNDFQGKGISQEESELLSDKIRSKMAASELFKVMTRGEMSAILEEQEFQQSGMCDDATCVAELGMAIGVDKIVTGVIGKLGNLYTVTMKMIDVSTSEIVYSVSVDKECSIEEFTMTYTGELVSLMEAEVRKSIRVAMTIQTDPTDAMVSINDTLSGKSPFHVEGLVPGEYKVSIKKDTYMDTVMSFTLNEGDHKEQSFTLKHTLVYTDSLRKSNVKRRVGGRVVSFLVMAALGTTGAIFDAKIATTVESLEDLKETYDNAGLGSDWKSYHQQEQGYSSDIETYAAVRNLSYGAAGVAGTIFVVSIPLKHKKAK